MREHPLNKFDNFIHGVYLDDTTICDKIIEYHKIGFQEEGVVGGDMSKGTHNVIVDKTTKNSIDVKLDHNGQLYIEYFKQLSQCMYDYTHKYIYSNGYDPWAIIDSTNIQMYKPSGGFYKWHSERVCSSPPSSTRHLVFMTYLNDVADEGETEFYYQKLKVKPEKGLTLIWPADWTFTHRGIPSMSETKYIVTGWYNYIPSGVYNKVASMQD